MPPSIPFYQHDFGELERLRAEETLRSNWINTGPRVAEFEKRLLAFLECCYFGRAEKEGAPRVMKSEPRTLKTVSSAWAGLFLTLKIFGIRAGDEVITTPYTFGATANVIEQNGARVVFADIGADGLLCPEAVRRKLTAKTKAVIGMDYAGRPCDYRRLRESLIERQAHFKPASELQEFLGRPLLLGDGAHSFGARLRRSEGTTEGGEGKGDKNFLPLELPDVYVYSFHSVKNLTTGDGGAVWVLAPQLKEGGLFMKQLVPLTLHGMDRGAFFRSQNGTMEYDLVSAGYKLNLTDLEAALGLAQLERFGDFFSRRKQLEKKYAAAFSGHRRLALLPLAAHHRRWEVCPHLFTLRLNSASPLPIANSSAVGRKATFLKRVREKGVELNLHYRPLPLMSHYKKQGHSMGDYPKARQLFQETFSLPFYTKLTEEESDFVIKTVLAAAH